MNVKPEQMQRFVEYRTLELVCYGCGDSFDLSKFLTPANRDHAKPVGGLWTSPVDSEFGWAQWCEGQDFGDLSTSFKLKFTGHVYVIDCVEAAKCMPWRNIDFLKHLCWPDYEAIQGVDAIYLTKKGEYATRYSDPWLFGWDCETVFVMNPACISAI